MTNTNDLITYAELTELYGHEAAHDLLLVIEQNGETQSNVVLFCKEQRLRQALARLDSSQPSLGTKAA